MKVDTAVQWQAMKSRLGIPPGAPFAFLQLTRTEAGAVGWMLYLGGDSERATKTGVSRLSWQWPGKWAKYTIYLFGVVRRLEEWPSPWPCWTWQVGERPVQVGDEAIELYLQTAHYPGCAPYAELRWDPDHGTTSAIREADNANNTDVLRALEGLRLLLQLPPNRVGRPPKLDLTDKDRSETECFLRLVDSGVFKETAAQLVGRDLDTLKRWAAMLESENTE